MLKKLTITLFFQSVTFASLFAQTAAQDRKEVENERDSFLRMNRQIFARHEDPGSGDVSASDQMKSIEIKLRTALQGSIARALRAPGPTASEVTDAVREIQGEMTFGRTT